MNRRVAYGLGWYRQASVDCTLLCVVLLPTPRFRLRDASEPVRRLREWQLGNGQVWPGLLGTRRFTQVTSGRRACVLAGRLTSTAREPLVSYAR